MRHQMKAVFDDRGEAQQALDRLTSSGYARAEARLAVLPGARHAGARAVPVKWREHASTSAARFLSRFLHRAHSDAASAADKPHSPDSYLLTLATYSESDAKRAALLVPALVRIGAEHAGLETSAASTRAKGSATARGAKRPAI